MTQKIRQTIDTSEADREFLKKFSSEVGTLGSMVIEILEDHPSMILSPTFREVLVEKAKIVRKMLFAMKGQLCCDNPCEDLKISCS